MADTRSGTPQALTPATVTRTLLLAAAVITLALLTWQLSDVILLGFAAALFAIILRSLAGLLERVPGLRPSWSLALAGLLLLATAAGFVLLLGAQIQSEGMSLISRLPELVSAFGDRIGIENLQQRLTEQAARLSQSSGVAGTIAGFTSGFLGAIANIVLVIVAGLYLAARPRRYRHGLLLLIPRRSRAEAAATFDNAAQALRLWLLGQLISMAIVGVLTTIGLYAIGLPSALALGFLAGVAEFVPVVGPALSAIPALLLALSEGGPMVFWVLGLYVLVQQIEGNVIMPLVQRRTVDLPPVLTLFGILAMGILFGPLGILLGTPLTVVAFVAVKRLYLRDALGEEVEIPGETG